MASDAGIAQPTAKAWISVFEASFIVFRRKPFYANIRKRLVKMPKLHFYDTGLVCWLLGIRSADQLRNHPLRGAIFESWVVSEIIKHRNNHGEKGGVFFYRDQHGLEADILVECGDQLSIVEVKAGQTVSKDMFRSPRRVQNALKTEGPTQTLIINGGESDQKREDLHIYSWDRLDEHNWTA